jgi:hypothetical protein
MPYMPARHRSRHELAEQVRLAAIKAAKHQKKMDRLRGPVRVGQIVVIGVRKPLYMWLIAKEHPEDRRLLLAVPADPWRVSEVGPLDVESSLTIRSDSIAPGLKLPKYVYRCNHALWLEQVLIGDLSRADVAPPADVKRVQELLEKIFAGSPIASAEEHGAWMYDQDYMEWFQVVEASREAVYRWHNRLGRVIRADVDTQSEPPTALRRALGKELRHYQQHHDYPLAAEGTGLAARLDRLVRNAARARYTTIDADRGLYAIWQLTGVELWWIPPSPNSRPPAVYHQQADQWQRVAWERRRAAGSSPPQFIAQLPWSDDRVVLRLGARGAPVALLR